MLQLIGAAAFMAGAALCMVVIFSRGGAAKSKQFRVIGEVLRNRHGAGWRTALIVGFALVVVGAVSSLIGVGAKDRARAKRCQEHCLREGFERGAIGPSDETKPNSEVAAFVACTCTRADGARVQHRASD